MTGIIEATDYKFDEDDVEESFLDSLKNGIAKPVETLPESVKQSIQAFDYYISTIKEESKVGNTDTLAYTINKTTSAIMLDMLKRTLQEFYKCPNNSTVAATISVITTLNASLSKMKQTENSKDLPDKIIKKVTAYFLEYIKQVYGVLHDKISTSAMDKKIADELKVEIRKIGEAADVSIGKLQDEIRKDFEV